MSYNQNESSRESGSPVEFYDFVIGSTTYRHCSGEDELSFGGFDYSPLPITRDPVVVGAEERTQSIAVEVPATFAFVRQYINGLPGLPASVTVRRVHRFDDDAEVLSLFQGRVQSVAFINDGASAKISVKPITGAQSRSIPLFVYSGLCNHVLGMTPGDTSESQTTIFNDNFSYTPGDLNGQGNWEQISWSTSDASWEVAATPDIRYSYDVGFVDPHQASAQNAVAVATLDTTQSWRISFTVKFHTTTPLPPPNDDIVAPGQFTVSIGNSDGSTQWSAQWTNEIGGFAFPLVLSAPGDPFAQAHRDDISWANDTEISFSVTYNASTGTMEIKQGSTSLLTVSDIVTTDVESPLLYLFGTNANVTNLSVVQLVPGNGGTGGCPVELDSDVSPITNETYPSGVPFKRVGEVTAINSNIYTVDGLDAFPENWFRGGHVKTSNVDYRLILSHNGNEIKLLAPFDTTSADVGDNITVYAGCDHTVTGPHGCKKKFNVVSSFGGFPFVPTLNPFQVGLL